MSAAVASAVSAAVAALAREDDAVQGQEQCPALPREDAALLTPVDTPAGAVGAARAAGTSPPNALAGNVATARQVENGRGHVLGSGTVRVLHQPGKQTSR